MFFHRGLLKLIFYLFIYFFFFCNLAAIWVEGKGREGPVLVSFLDNPPANLDGKPRNKLSYMSFFSPFISHRSFAFYCFHI